MLVTNSFAVGCRALARAAMCMIMQCWTRGQPTPSCAVFSFLASTLFGITGVEHVMLVFTSMVIRRWS
jgi:hypothetical protein